MWRSVLAMLLVPSLMWSQNSILTPSATQNPQSNSVQARVPESTNQSLTQLQIIRRGTTEKAAVLFGSDSAVLPPQQIGVQLPVTVVDHDAEAKNTKTARSDAGGTPVLLWILAPLLIPLIVVMAIVCGVRGEDCSC